MINQSIVHIEFQNGETKNYSIQDFEYFANTNELEHMEESIIISLNSPQQSFRYILDNNDEILYKEYIKVTFE